MVDFCTLIYNHHNLSVRLVTFFTVLYLTDLKYNLRSLKHVLKLRYLVSFVCGGLLPLRP